MMIEPDRLTAAYEKVRADLLAQRTAERHWEGELSASALSTATAISTWAIALQHSAHMDPQLARADQQHIDAGINWLLLHQNPDGGWGDTDKSHSNISTTMLVVAAIHLAGRAEQLADQLERANAYIERQGGIAGLRRRYGKDKTFAVPILTNYALAGLADWSEVSPLPFELACVPQRFYRWTRMPVVSYAVPALVAIGQARYFQLPSRFPGLRWARRWAVAPSLRVLERMQPHSGGYLEAVPLTSFVTMSLAATGRVDHCVTQRGLAFIRDSVRPDGSLPIDTNLATWNTTLAINALAVVERDVLAEVDLNWLLGCQHTQRHPFTGAAPGGWGWTDLSGAVPDADDTAGALLALATLRSTPNCTAEQRQRIERAAKQGVIWLLGLQNRDGGWPTFCRGWGKLPFDRSGADLTAHVLRALRNWREGRLASRIDRAMKRGQSYLRRHQRPGGDWVPLWFGHQDHPDEENPVFGTARVLKCFEELGCAETPAALRGYGWLESVQQSDGGWSGGARGAADDHPPRSPSTVEETAMAVEALLGAPNSTSSQLAVARGLEWLVGAVEADLHRESAPIGFYFAKLWYHERLYPLVFVLAALGQAVRHWAPQPTHFPTELTVSASNNDAVPRPEEN